MDLEKASGKAVKGRPELEKAIDALGKGDIIVAEWDRAAFDDGWRRDYRTYPRPRGVD